MERRGRADLILPIHYLDVSAFDTIGRLECYDQAVLPYLRTLQWTDFRSLRLRPATSEEVQRKVDELATGILGALYRLQRTVLSLRQDSTRLSNVTDEQWISFSQYVSIGGPLASPLAALPTARAMTGRGWKCPGIAALGVATVLLDLVSVVPSLVWRVANDGPPPSVAAPPRRR